MEDLPNADPLVPLRAGLKALVACFRKNRVKGMLIGGAAAAALGEPRVTNDIDAVVLLAEDRWPGFLASAGQFGLEPRVKDVIGHARRERVLRLRHRPSNTPIDLCLALFPFEEEMIQRATKRKVADVVVPLPTPEDFVIMKAIARRPRDIIDITKVLDRNPGIDVDHIRAWLRQFGKEIEVPEILTEFDALLARWRQGLGGGKWRRRS